MRIEAHSVRLGGGSVSKTKTPLTPAEIVEAEATVAKWRSLRPTLAAMGVEVAAMDLSMAQLDKVVQIQKAKRLRELEQPKAAGSEPRIEGEQSR
jgi:hypothetical protein